MVAVGHQGRAGAVGPDREALPTTQRLSERSRERTVLPIHPITVGRVARDLHAKRVPAEPDVAHANELVWLRAHARHRDRGKEKGFGDGRAEVAASKGARGTIEIHLREPVDRLNWRP